MLPVLLHTPFPAFQPQPAPHRSPHSHPNLAQPSANQSKCPVRIQLRVCYFKAKSAPERQQVAEGAEGINSFPVALIPSLWF